MLIDVNHEVRITDLGLSQLMMPGQSAIIPTSIHGKSTLHAFSLDLVKMIKQNPLHFSCKQSDISQVIVTLLTIVNKLLTAVIL